MATLGNAVCGFAAMYVAALPISDATAATGLVAIDPVTAFFSRHHFVMAVYLIFFAMICDALDGRLARLTRHTTDFGGQLDSLADVISFGAAPAFVALQIFKSEGPQGLPDWLTRLIWAIGALYMSCAAMRLARFNVSNEHGEQHHFSFLGLPSPGAGGCVAAFILMQQQLVRSSTDGVRQLGAALLYALPVVVLVTGLLMVSNIRYPHIVNRYLSGKRSFARLIVVFALVLMLVVSHQITLGVGTLAYVLVGLLGWGLASFRRKPPASVPTAA
jgi:CDP-diacylglycerol--serine O-phosphatidyltransferase